MVLFASPCPGNNILSAERSSSGLSVTRGITPTRFKALTTEQIFPALYLTIATSITIIIISTKYNRLVLIYQHLPFNMLLHGTRKNNLLQILSLANQVLHRVLMCDAYNILLDDGASVQLRSHIMTGCTYNLHTTFKSRMIRLGTHKCRQERMMNIDNTIRICVNHLLRNHLHVACQYNECYTMLGQ